MERRNIKKEIGKRLFSLAGPFAELTSLVTLPQTRGTNLDIQIYSQQRNCIVSTKPTGAPGGTIIYTSIADRSISIAVNNDEIKSLPPVPVDSSVDGRPASSWNIRHNQSISNADFKLRCNTGARDPEIIAMVLVPRPTNTPTPTTEIAYAPSEITHPSTKPIEFIAGEQQGQVPIENTPTPLATSTPTLSIPQVKQTSEAVIAAEEKRIAEIQRQEQEDREKEQIRLEAEQKIQQAQAKATLAAQATPTSKPTSTIAPSHTPLPTETPLTTPPVVSTFIQDNLQNLQDELHALTSNLYDLKKHLPSSRDLLTYGLYGGASLGGVLLLRKSVGIFKNRIQKGGSLPSAATNTQRAQHRQRNARTYAEPSSQAEAYKDSDADLSDLIYDANGNLNLPKTEQPSIEIDNRTLIALERGEKTEGPLSGSHIDQYDIREIVGYGSFSSVYKAYDPSLRTYRAIKILRPELYGNLPLVNQFLYEARIMANLDHLNIAKVFSTGRPSILEGASKFYYMSTEFIDGKSLKTLYEEKQRHDLPQTAEYIAQLTEALSYAHSQRVVHADLHPNNIMLNNRGQIKVIDLGSAIKTTWTELIDRYNATTQMYTAPELVRGTSPSIKSDIYSLGVVCFELLTGQLPSGDPSDNRLALEKSIRKQGLLTDRLIEELLKNLSADPAKRAPSLNNFKDLIRIFKDHL